MAVNEVYEGLGDQIVEMKKQGGYLPSVRISPRRDLDAGSCASYFPRFSFEPRMTIHRTFKVRSQIHGNNATRLYEEIFISQLMSGIEEIFLMGD